MQTIVKAVKESWKVPFRIPSVGYYSKDEKELKEIRLYDWIEGLGKGIWFESIDKAWENRVNERNKEYVDTIIREMMKEDVRNLDNSLIKAVAWMHNTCDNKMGGVPVELVTGKQIEVSGLEINEDDWRDIEDLR